MISLSDARTRSTERKAADRGGACSAIRAVMTSVVSAGSVLSGTPARAAVRLTSFSAVQPVASRARSIEPARGRSAARPRRSDHGPRSRSARTSAECRTERAAVSSSATNASSTGSAAPSWQPRP